jgi:hypothetical protein
MDLDISAFVPDGQAHIVAAEQTGGDDGSVPLRGKLDQLGDPPSRTAVGTAQRTAAARMQ